MDRQMRLLALLTAGVFVLVAIALIAFRPPAAPLETPAAPAADADVPAGPAIEPPSVPDPIEAALPDDALWRRAVALAAAQRPVSPTAIPFATVALADLAEHGVTAACAFAAGTAIRPALAAVGRTDAAIPEITVAAGSTGLVILGPDAASYTDIPAATMAANAVSPCLSGSFLSLRLSGDPPMEAMLVDVVP